MNVNNWDIIMDTIKYEQSKLCNGILFCTFLIGMNAQGDKWNNLKFLFNECSIITSFF